MNVCENYIDIIFLICSYARINEQFEIMVDIYSTVCKELNKITEGQNRNIKQIMQKKIEEITARVRPSLL
jgi:hypothetical protein